MELNKNPDGQTPCLLHQEGAARNERFVSECLKKIRVAPNAEEGLRSLLQFLGESLECDRVYVFEEMDRQHIRNTYEWCREGVSSGIEQLPYLAKKDLLPWYIRLAEGGNIIEPEVENLNQSDRLIYDILHQQEIRSVILSPLLTEGKMVGLLGADNPPPEKMKHISVLFDVLAYFVCSLVGERELQKLRGERDARDVLQRPKATAIPRYVGKTVLLVDDSPEMLKCNERVLRPEGYTVQTAKTIHGAKQILERGKPDAIVMDIDLPDGSGMDFCRRLRGHYEIPVVFLTAHSDAQTARQGIAAGGCAFLTKPYQLEDLRKAVADAVEGNESGSETFQKACKVRSEEARQG